LLSWPHWALAQFGHVDILVNNAARDAGQPRLPMSRMDLATWNLSAQPDSHLFCLTCPWLPGMQARGYWRINISSTTGTCGSNPGEAAASAAKSRHARAYHMLALEVAKQGSITINSVAPG
jgi:3-oxoacyl-[acyl-carrier protein] reductase